MYGSREIYREESLPAEVIASLRRIGGQSKRGTKDNRSGIVMVRSVRSVGSRGQRTLIMGSDLLGF